jgi:hypothetical protein
LLTGLLFPIHFGATFFYQEKYGASHRVDRVRAVIFSDVIGEDETKIAASVDLAREDWPQRRPVA